MRCECEQRLEFDSAEAREYADGHLAKTDVDVVNWLVRYACPVTKRTWIMDYPQAEYHGGGPPRLRQLDAEGTPIAPRQ